MLGENGTVSMQMLKDRVLSNILEDCDANPVRFCKEDLL